ncbi:hypothetical protein Taro_008021 [Colocasia esculenta]|uniref:Uncharacterized protein n=1 Tax=Colocasia esculenta TaxID=4460 RepID=A0A843U5Q0_COLES|nr:hypothetical protein [Colocasia esculenta]
MSPSQFQRVKCPSREHKPQFGLLSEKTLLLWRTGAWELRGAWEEPSWLSCKGEEALGSWEEARGSSELGGETSQQFPPRRSEETGPQ